MAITLNIFVVLTMLGGIFLTIGAADQRTSSLGAVASGLFVCMGLCLYSLTRLNIAEKQAARDQHQQKEN